MIQSKRVYLASSENRTAVHRSSSPQCSRSTATLPWLIIRSAERKLLRTSVRTFLQTAATSSLVGRHSLQLYVPVSFRASLSSAGQSVGVSVWPSIRRVLLIGRLLVGCLALCHGSWRRNNAIGTVSCRLLSCN